MVTAKQLRVYEQVTGIADPVAECVRRWPDFAFVEENRATPAYVGRAIEARYTRDNVPCGMTSPIALCPTDEEREATKRHLAIAVLLRAEHEKG